MTSDQAANVRHQTNPMERSTTAPPGSPSQRTSHQKDGWDKFSAVSTFFSGVLVTLGVAGATLYFENRQSHRKEELRRIEILEGFLPHLADEELREPALLAIDVLGPHELAFRIAALFGGESADKALLRIAKLAEQLDSEEVVDRAIEVRNQLLQRERDLSVVGQMRADGEQREVTASEAIRQAVRAGGDVDQLSEVVQRLHQEGVEVTEPGRSRLEREIQWEQIRRRDAP